MKHTLYKGDCLEVMDKLIKDGVKVDLILTDPPYGTTACSWDSVIPLDKMWSKLKQIITNTGCIAIFGSEPFSSNLRMKNIEDYKYDWIWEKGRASGFVHAKNKPLKAHENISIFSKGTTVHKNQSKRRMYYEPIMSEGEPYKKKITQCNTGKLNHSVSKANLDFVGTVNENEGTRYPRSVLKFSMHNVGNIHPTQKPVELLEYLIKTYTNENMTVLDFTFGSNSTGIACLNTYRNYIGIEKDDTYFDLAVDRTKKHIKDNNIECELEVIE